MPGKQEVERPGDLAGSIHGQPLDCEELWMATAVEG